MIAKMNRMFKKASALKEKTDDEIIIEFMAIKEKSSLKKGLSPDEEMDGLVLIEALMQRDRYDILLDEPDGMDDEGIAD
jgi:hypothetical protein